ncbi:SMC family ATPase [Isoptericola sp. b490]|uniref:AAA family ATPase n=1 Tax=Actinotalea lenta TaxID=3064654 RepID=UPI0027142F5B|nr:SMC family ATPase [Isoptericola sp. b490]MDO8122213.1 SMC family ATPase [Isoptericola sp. b490]
MRLVRMSLGALGPFPGEHTVDFDELGASGLFLLEGATGAGKSTLIDAVVFALYGKVASAGASEDRLRSAHAPAAAETYVDLTFATGAGLFRVRRTPAYPRPKQRGSGTTTQPAGVRLWRLTSPDAPGDLLSSRMDEVGLEIQRVVGLDRAQFVQTVVLPQGEFAAFLRADPEQRRSLLQKVFGTEVFDRVQQRLERMRADATRAVTEAEQVVARRVAQLCGAVGDLAAAPFDGSEVPLSELLASAPPAEAAALAGTVLDRLSRQAHRAQEQAEEAATQAATARTEHDRLREVAARVARRDALRREWTALEAETPSHTERSVRWEAAQVVERVWPWIEGERRAGEAMSGAADEHARARAAASPDLRAVVGEGDPDVVLKALDGELELCAATRERLKRAVALEDGLAARRDDLAARRESALAARGTVQREREELAELPGRRAGLVTQRDGARAAASGLAPAQVELAQAGTRLVAAREIAPLTEQLDVAEQSALAREEDARHAVDALARAHAARIAGIAGELAAQLVPGRPCAVCGSTEHPAPASHVRPTRAPEDPELAEAARAAAQDALQQAVTQVEVLRAAVAARREAAGGDAEQAERAVAAAQVAVSEARAAQDRVAELSREIETLDQDLADRRAAVADRASAIALDEERTEHLAARLAEDELEVLAAADGAPSARLRDEEFARRAGEARRWSAALRVLVDATDHHRTAERERDEALAAAGVALHDALRDRLPAGEIAALRHELDRYDRERARVGAALEAPELADLPDAVDGTVLARAQEALDAAQHRAEAGQREAAVLADRADATRTATADLASAVTELDAQRAAAAPVVRMANVATASGGAGTLTLATYVLGQRFEDLVAAANARLTGISDGRYELVRSAEREAVRTRRLGLAMQVVDHRTGVARDPRTLSGGETFYVSLCLALGLADVVTAEAGGVELGTLLIDEGFGALDAETLEVVLAELSRLRDGGRVVGVVSHVETLKTAIPERIEIRRRPDGASTLTVRA